MTKNSRSQGFAHALLVIGLVIALLGALGFIFWQNFIHSESVVPKTETTTTDKPTDDQFLTLGNWGVKVPLADSSDAYSLGSTRLQESEGGEYMYVFNKEAATGCETGSTIGSVARFNAEFEVDVNGTQMTAREMTSNQAQSNNVAVVDKGKYVYAFYPPQAACSDDIDANERGSKAATKFGSLFKGLVEE